MIGIDLCISGPGIVTASNSPAAYNYSCTDAGAAVINVTKLYYRLKQIDIYGRYTYSQTVLLRLSKINSGTIYPNLATDVFTISFSNKTLLHTVAIITDMQVKQLKQFTIRNYQEQVETSNRPKGMYLIKFEEGTSVKLNKN
jgi:hypothetical protein